MVLFQYMINIYKLITQQIEELKKDSTFFLHKYLGIDDIEI